MSETISTPLDLRGGTPAAAQQLVLNKAKSLQQGKSFQPLVGLGADVAWAYHESGPATWRVQVSKRAVEMSNCCSGGACCG